jgi:hypothetical protein
MSRQPINFETKSIVYFSPKANGVSGLHPRPPRLSGSRWRAGGKPGKKDPENPVNPVKK